MFRMLFRRSSLRLAIMLAVLLSVVLFIPSRDVSAKGVSFQTFELAQTPGITCPGGGANCTNIAAEPQIRADLGGNFFASSENGLGGGTEAWRSSDGGQHYTSLTSPNAVS